MKITQRPILTTIFFGLMCGLSFVPISIALGYFLYWPVTFRLTIWAYLVLYLFLLTRWGNVSLLSVVFPILLLLIAVFLGHPGTAFLFLALGILSWIRSGICFHGGLLKMLAAELAICLGGAVLVAYFGPHSTMSWAMAVWMFFLVQSLYFVVFADIGAAQEEKIRLDPFDQARGQAEKILSSELQ